jgi:hypothetical protein
MAGQHNAKAAQHNAMAAQHNAKAQWRKVFFNLFCLRTRQCRTVLAGKLLYLCVFAPLRCLLLLRHGIAFSS